MPRPKDHQAAAVCRQHGLLGVDDQIQQDLLNLVRICEYRRKPRRECLENDHVSCPLFVRAQTQRLTHDGIQIHHRPRRVAFPCERLQVTDDPGGPLGRVVDRIEVASRLVVEPAAREPLRARQNRRERIVELVRHPRHGLPERRQFLGLRQLMVEVARLVLQLLPLCDVVNDRFDAKSLG
jgi:hypothetical protein